MCSTWETILWFHFFSIFLFFFFFFLTQVDTQYLRGPHITEVDREGLETAVLGLEFRLRTKHFKRGDLKIKCLATIATVYWKSNELSIEGERPLKMPVMESRETRAQGHTHAEHILGGKKMIHINIYMNVNMIDFQLFLYYILIRLWHYDLKWTSLKHVLSGIYIWIILYDISQSKVIKKLFLWTKSIKNVERRFFVGASILKEKHFEEIA